MIMDHRSRAQVGVLSSTSSVLTRMEIIPLCFCSTKSQMILLLKYGIGSHWKRKKRWPILEEVLFFAHMKNASSKNKKAGCLLHWWSKAFSVIVVQRQKGGGKIRSYLYSFQFIFLLLCFQGHLNQQLLELLIAVINAELLKASEWLNKH